RKLWLLNGAHTVLSTTARSLGHATVGDAIADPTVRGWVDEFWNTAETWLPEPELELGAYRGSLIERFSNTRIVHHLDQIAAETTMKLRFRIVPVLLSEREAGRMPEGCVRPLAGWIRALRSGTRDPDASRAQIDEILADTAGEPLRAAAALMALLHPSLGADENLVARVSEEAERAVARPVPSR
ncbi:MAG: mannitol dehydrogenase family protein, partial [Microbacterium sp.]